MSQKQDTPSCLLCFRSKLSGIYFRILESYGDYESPVDISSFLGREQINWRQDDYICSRCATFFGITREIKRIANEYLQNRDLLNNEIASNYQEDVKKNWRHMKQCFLQDDCQSPSSVAGSDNRQSTPTLLVLSRSEDYNERMESRFEMDNHYGRSDGEADEEVNSIMGKKKLKRKNNHWSRRKGEQKSRARSRAPDSFSNGRPYSSASKVSCVSAPEASLRPMRRKKRIASVEAKPLRTRSVSRVVNNITITETNNFHCMEIGCTVTLTNLDAFVAHKIHDHNIYPRYDCSSCSKSYTTKDELRIHAKIHDTDILRCFYCQQHMVGREMFQNHLRLHLQYTIDCHYCYNSFLTKSELKEHVQKVHRYDKKKVVRPKNLPMIRIQKPNYIEPNNNERRAYVSKVLIDRTPSPTNDETPAQISFRSEDTITMLAQDIEEPRNGAKATNLLLRQDKNKILEG